MTRTRTYPKTLLAAAAVAMLAACSDSAPDSAAAARPPVSKAEVTEVVLSPSGLPVGLLEGRVTRTSGVVDVSNVRILVRSDGTGAVGFGGGHDGGGGKDVDYVRLGPGSVAVRYAGPICASPRALTLGFTVQGRTLTIESTKLDGCFTSPDLAADLVGAALHISPLPPDATAGNG
jgi:hypothetical protein